jgi:hypothetical protein
MFKSENYIQEIRTAIDDFYIDYEEEALSEKSFKYAQAIHDHKNRDCSEFCVSI